MYRRVRRKMKFEISAILVLSFVTLVFSKAFDIQRIHDNVGDDTENDIIDFDDEFSVKYDKKYKVLPWDSNDHRKDSYRYTVIKDKVNEETRNEKIKAEQSREVNTTFSVLPIDVEKTTELSVIPLELISTTDSVPINAIESTTEFDLTVIPLSKSEKPSMEVIINQTVTLPVSTETSEDYNSTTVFYEMTTKAGIYLNETSTEIIVINETTTEKNELNETTTHNLKHEISTQNLIKETLTLSSTTLNVSEVPDIVTILPDSTTEPITKVADIDNATEYVTDSFPSTTIINEVIIKNSSKTNDTINREDYDSTEVNPEVPIYTELDTEDISEVPEDYYDSKDIVPTSAPKTDALSVIFGFAGSVVESVVENVAERVVPKSLMDLFRRMQKQNEALEAEKLRSREENGGLGIIFFNFIARVKKALNRKSVTANVNQYFR